MQEYLELVRTNRKNGYSTFLEAAFKKRMPQLITEWKKYLNEVHKNRDRILRIPASETFDSIAEASSAFSDENARLKHDHLHSNNEDRFILLEFSSKLRILVVCHAYRREETEMRIISARKANKNERKQYGSFL